MLINYKYLLNLEFNNKFPIVYNIKKIIFLQNLINIHVKYQENQII